MTDAHVPIETLLRHADWVHALASRLVADDATANDVVQETWMAALRRPPRPGSPRAWLGTVLRNVARQRVRADGRRQVHEAFARPRADAEAADEIVARADAHRRVVEAVMELDDPYRATVLMRFFDGLPAREIAARTGVPVDTVRTRTRRAIGQLRQTLDRRDGGDGRGWRAMLAPLLLADRPALVATAAGTATAATTGVLAMSLTAKVAATAVLALVAAATWWTLAGPAERPIGPVAGPSKVAEEPGVKGPEDPGGAALANQAPAPKPPVREVRVSTAAGASVDGAVVIAFSGEEVLARGRTDSRGELELGLAAAARLLVVAPGRPVVVGDLRADGRTVVVLAEGFLVDGIVRVDGAAPRRPIRLTLRPDLPVLRRGDVPDAVRRLLVSELLDPATVVAVTDAAGRFRFEGLPRETSARLSPPLGFEVGGGPAMRIEVPARDVLVELESFPLIRGRVVTADGAPAAKARLSLTVSQSGGLTTEVVRHAGTDGAFEIAVPVRSATRIKLEVAGADGRGMAVLDLGEIEPGPRDLGDIRLEAVRTVRVVVRDASGSPVAQAIAAPPYGTKPLAGPSGVDGALELPLRDGPTAHVIAALGYAPVEVVLAAEDVGPRIVELQPAPVLLVRVTGVSEQRPAGLRLIVQADDGKDPVAFDVRLSNALVAAGGAMRDDRREELVGIAEFLLTREVERIAGLRPDQHYTLTLVDLLGVPHGEERVWLSPGRSEQVEFRIEAPVRTVRGRVVDAVGGGIPGAKVRLNSAEHEGSPLVATTDAEGRFDIPGVAASTARLLVIAERFAMREIDDIPVTADEIVVRLQGASTVRVRVFDAEGAPVTKALVSMRLPAGEDGRMLARLARRVGEGVFELRDVPHEEVTISVRVDGKSHPFTIDGRVEETTIRLP